MNDRAPPQRPRVTLGVWLRIWLDLHIYALWLAREQLRGMFAALARLWTTETVLEAIERGATRKVARLVRGGTDLSSCTDSQGRTALHIALDRLEEAADEEGTSSQQAAERLELVRFLVDQQVNVNGRDQQERAPIHMAVQAGFRGVARSLLDARADPTVPCKGMSTLRQAIVRRDAQMVALLLDAAASCDRVPAGGGEGRPAAPSLGEYVNRAGRDGWSALGLASRTGDAAIVEALLDAGADVAAVNASGKTALDVARLNRKDAGWQERPGAVPTAQHA